MKIGIIYNLVKGSQKGTVRDGISDNDILNTVEMVKSGLENEHQVLPIRVTTEVIRRLNKGSVDMIFNLCEGFGGRAQGEAWLAGYMDLMDIPYTGSGPFCLFLCLDKARTKQILRANNIPTPNHQVFYATSQKLDTTLKFPMIVKPLREDASIGISQSSVVENKHELFRMIDRVIETYMQPAIVEEYLDGREINVSMIGNPPYLRVLPVSEILFDLPEKAHKIVDFDAKWIEGSGSFRGTSAVCPAPLDKELRIRVEAMAKRAYSLTECRDYGRVDIRIVDGQPHVLEVNPNPGIGEDSGFFRSFKQEGMDYRQMVDELLNIAIHRNMISGRSFPKGVPFCREYKGLTYREVLPKDLGQLLTWMNDPDIAIMMDDPHNPVLEEHLMARIFLEKKDLDLMVLDEKKHPVGFCSAYDITEWNSTCEISYMIGEKGKRGSGLGSRMVNGFIDICRDKLRAKRLIARSVDGNHGSIRVLLSTGFRQVGTLTGSHITDKGPKDELLFELNSPYGGQNTEPQHEC